MVKQKGTIGTHFKDGFYAGTILAAASPLVLKILGKASPEIARLIAALVICFPFKLDSRTGTSEELVKLAEVSRNVHLLFHRFSKAKAEAILRIPGSSSVFAYYLTQSRGIEEEVMDPSIS